jgi:Cu/Zn superoxide dismutase
VLLVCVFAAARAPCVFAARAGCRVWRSRRSLLFRSGAGAERDSRAHAQGVTGLREAERAEDCRAAHAHETLAGMASGGSKRRRQSLHQHKRGRCRRPAAAALTAGPHPAPHLTVGSESRNMARGDEPCMPRVRTAPG